MPNYKVKLSGRELGIVDAKDEKEAKSQAEALYGALDIQKIDLEGLEDAKSQDKIQEFLKKAKKKKKIKHSLYSFELVPDEPPKKENTGVHETFMIRSALTATWEMTFSNIAEAKAYCLTEGYSLFDKNLNPIPLS